MTKSFPDRALVDQNPLFPKQFTRCKTQGRILQLMVTDQLQFETRPGMIHSPIGNRTIGSFPNFEIRIQAEQLASPNVRNSLQHRQHPRLAGSGHHRYSLLDDASFFPCNIFKGSSQILLMLQSHIGDHGNRGNNDVCGIHPTAHAGFHDNPVDLPFCENGKSHGCRIFEEGRFSFTRNNRSNGQIGFENFVVRCQLTIDGNALVELNQMRGSIHADRVPRFH